MIGRQPSPTVKTYPKIGRVSYRPRQQKHMRLSVKAGEVRLSYPRRVKFETAEKFLLTKVDWVLKHRRPAVELTDGCRIGRQHQLKLTTGRQRPRLNGQQILAPADEPAVTAKLIKQALVKEAQEYILPLADELAATTGLKPRTVKLRYMKTQWGSCNTEQTICLNTALVYLPHELASYIIVHELCHLKFLNHSAKFWALVEAKLPNHAHFRQELRHYTIGLIVTKKASPHQLARAAKIETTALRS